MPGPPAQLRPKGFSMIISEALQEKLNALKAALAPHPHLGIAFSGGMDSTFLLAFAISRAGSEQRITAITVDAPSFAPDEIAFTKEFCRSGGIHHLLIPLALSDIQGLADNGPERCYFCKKSIFSAVKEIAGSHGISALADGSNLDDDRDYRPGKRALKELGILSPLREAAMTKENIRQAAFSMGLPVWDKPAYACLATRIPCGDPITEVKLRAVYLVEQEIRRLGFRQVRVRHHGEIARIEIAQEEMPSFLTPDIFRQVRRTAEEAGFRYAALDLAGYQMGSTNPTDSLPGVSHKSKGSRGSEESEI